VTAGPLVIVGDALLDRDVHGHAERLCPDAPAPVVEDATDRLRPGGAALAALLAARAGAEVVLIAPLGTDGASCAIRGLLPPSVTVVPLPISGPPPEKTRVLADGRTLLRFDRSAGTPGAPTPAALRVIAAAGGLLVCDYGRGTTALPQLRDALAGRAARVPLVWDPHPRGSEPVPGTRICTPNEAEALGAVRDAGPARYPRPAGGGRLAAAAAADGLLDMWAVDGVAVTLGGRGALLARRGQAPFVVPAVPLQVADACGAGDQFAAAATLALQGGSVVSEAVTAAVAAASGYLAAGGVARLLPRDEPAGTASAGDDPDAEQAAARVRADGGTLIAAGGCFDVLHAGHVAMLRAARSLGDCLVVCLNSDASVSRLKGAGRPLNTAADRTAVLAALDCVDQVVVFGEDTPERLLRRLRPDIWVKGGDYDGQELPEAAALRSWGGRVVTVPYLTGRSTTALARAAAVQHAAAAGH